MRSGCVCNPGVSDDIGVSHLQGSGHAGATTAVVHAQCCMARLADGSRSAWCYEQLIACALKAV
jgi:hypothetical protein